MKTQLINQTSDYSKFESILGNRIINEIKVKKLTKDIEAGLNLLPYCPIIVYSQNGLFKIIDGQHRFEVSKLLNHPVHYIVCDVLNLRQIARLNSRSDKWSNRDFIACYVSVGVEDYVTLLETMQAHNLVYSCAVDFLMFGKIDSKQGGMEFFRDGEFKVRFLKETVDLAETVKDIFGRYKFYSHSRLLVAMQKLIKIGKIDLEVLKTKISQAPNIMDKQGTAKDYIYNIEKVYNFKNRKRERII